MKRLAPLLVALPLAVGPVGPATAQVPSTGSPSEAFTLTSPNRITTGRPGELWVTDYRGRRLCRVDPSNRKVLESFEIGGRALAVGTLRNRLLVGNDSTSQVQVWRRDGTLVGPLGGAGVSIGRPTDLEVDAVGQRVFVLDAEARHVKVFDVSQPGLGQLVATIGAPGGLEPNLQNPTAIEIDPAAQELYVCDFGDLGSGWPARVLVYGFDGTFHEAISGDGGPTGQYFARPAGIELSPATGHLLIVDSWRGEVVAIDRATKTQVGVLGGYGRAPGELLLPLDLVVFGPNDDLLVTSNRTSRIEVFAAGGQL